MCTSHVGIFKVEIGKRILTDVVKNLSKSKLIQALFFNVALLFIDRCRNITARRKRNALVEQAQEIRMQREGRMLMLKSISERANKKLDLSTSS